MKSFQIAQRAIGSHAGSRARRHRHREDEASAAFANGAPVAAHPLTASGALARPRRSAPSVKIGQAETPGAFLEDAKASIFRRAIPLSPGSPFGYRPRAGSVS